MAQPVKDGPPVDTRPSWLKNVQAEGTKPGTINVDGKPYMFTLVKPGLAPSLPYAVGFPDESALFISVDVPESHRPLIMSHEVREKTRFSKLPEDERCKASLQTELENARAALPDGYTEYVNSRRSFFDALVSFYGQPDQQTAVTDQFRQAIGASRDYLHSSSIT